MYFAKFVSSRKKMFMVPLHGKTPLIQIRSMCLQSLFLEESGQVGHILFFANFLGFLCFNVILSEILTIFNLSFSDHLFYAPPTFPVTTVIYPLSLTGPQPDSWQGIFQACSGTYLCIGFE